MNALGSLLEWARLAGQVELLAKAGERVETADWKDVASRQGAEVHFDTGKGAITALPSQESHLLAVAALAPGVLTEDERQRVQELEALHSAARERVKDVPKEARRFNAHEEGDRWVVIDKQRQAQGPGSRSERLERLRDEAHAWEYANFLEGTYPGKP